jgi:hypothetical protein
MFWSLLRWVLGITAMEERLAGMEERINMLEQVTPPPPPAPIPLYGPRQGFIEKEKVH